MIKKNKNINHYKKGSYIFIEGDDDTDSVYIVESGEVEFTSSNQYIKLIKMSAKKGDIFGFISSLLNRPRMETAIAKVDSTIIEIPKDKFITLLQMNSDIAFKLLNNYADELRTFDNMIFSMEKGKDVNTNDYNLFKLGKYYFDDNNYSNAYYILIRYLQLYPGNENVSDARELITKIESSGLRKIDEPIKKGIYHEYMDKQIIFCENEPGNELYVIKSGKVKIIKYANDSEIMLSVLKEGDIFGELAIVSNKPRNATAISYGITIVLPINKSNLVNLFNRAPEILNRIFSSISKRVWFTYIRLEALTHKKPFTKIYAFLENKLIEENVSLKSANPHIFNFGVDELLNMTDLSNEKDGDLINDLLADNNLTLNLGQIIINDPSAISAKARFYRSRDNLYVADDSDKQSNDDLPKKSNKEIKIFQEVEIKTDTKALDIDKSDVSKSTILKELDELMESE